MKSELKDLEISIKIIVPAERLAEATRKYLLPGLIRSLQEKKKERENGKENN